MKTASTITRLFAQKQKTLNIKELEPVLEMLNQAAILADLDEDTIALANKAAYDLSGQEQPGLVGQKLQHLFPPETGKGYFLDWERANLSEPFSLKMKTKGGSLLIQATTAFLGADLRWLLIKFEPNEDIGIQSDSPQQLLRKWEYIRKLAESLQLADSAEAMNQACQTSRELLGCEVMAVYQLNGSAPKLSKYCANGDTDWLPEQLNGAEIMQTQEIHIWRKGRRPGTALHQKARLAGFNLLISLPLGQRGAWSGLAIAASHEDSLEGFEEWLPIIQTLLSTNLQLHTLIKSQRLALNEMSHQEKIAEFIQNSIKDSLVMLDCDFRVQDMNQSAVEVLGYAHSEVIDQPVTSILIGGQKLDWLLEHVKQSTDSTDSEQIRLFRRSGNSFLANLRIMKLIEEQDHRGYLVLIQDLSELEEFRQRNEQLKQQALLGEVTASFAHETKNPINSLSTGIQLLQDSLKADDPLQENVRRLQQSCDRLNSVITSGLSFTRPMEYKMQPIRLEKLVHRLLNTTWQQRLHKHQVRAEYNSAPRLPMIEGDERALDHLLTNLFDNAIDAMSTNPPEVPRVLGIGLQAIPAPNNQTLVEVRISDTGPGIAENIREKIFEPFYTTKSSGTGVGLAIVKRITTAHRGLVKVDSFTGGTIFSIQIPAINAHAIQIEEVNG